MLASLIMEHRGVTLHASAQLAGTRIMNNGPSPLLKAIWGSFAGNRILVGITMGLYVFTLLVQLISTVLVSDLGTGDLDDSSSR